MFRGLARGLALALASTTCLSAPALAGGGTGRLGGAHGPQVISGDVTFSRSGGNIVIDVLSQDAVVDFPRFRIRPGASVAVEQLSQSSVFVGDVLHGPALIFGTLSANGQFVLTDPAGISIGPQGHVSAAGLVLSTAAPTAASLTTLATQAPLDFAIPGKPGAGIVNRGTIDVSAGAAILAGETVTNDGLIAASLGSVVLAGTKTYTVDFTGDGLLQFAVAGAPVDSVPSGTSALVANSGTITGGTVLLTAQAAKGVLDTVINTSGIIEATSAQNIGGKIVLLGSGGGTTVSGTLDASSKAAGTSGGTVEVLGDSVTLASTARIDVSGADGGGTALVGGNFHGAGPEPDATTTTVAQGAVIDADALASGNGGNVTVWSNAGTVFDGSITARGGAAGGNGGYVETSGETLTVGTGGVDTMAAAGAIGTWLLDPTNIVVSTGSDDTINPVAISNATSDVLLQTSGNITFEAFVVINQPGVDITLRAGNDIIVTPDGDINTTVGNITLSANDPRNSPSGSGSIILNGELEAGPYHYGSGNTDDGAILLTVNGGTGTLTLGGELITQSGAITIQAPVLVGYDSLIDTTNGGIAAGANVTIAGTVDSIPPGTGEPSGSGDIGQLSVVAGTGVISVTGNVGAQAEPLTVLMSGSTIALGGSVSTSGNQTYNAGTVTLSGPLYQAADGNIDVQGNLTISGTETQITAVDLNLGSIDGPGALALNATGVVGGGGDVVDGYVFPLGGNIVVGPIGANVPLSTLSASAAGAIMVSNVTTIGTQSYSDQTLYLAGTLYQTSGESFTQHGATILGTPEINSYSYSGGDYDDDGSDFSSAGSYTLAYPTVDTTGTLADPAVDTTGAGAFPAGAAITFTSPGSVDGDEAFTLTAGRSTVTLGLLGSTTPLGVVTIKGGNVIFNLPISPAVVQSSGNVDAGPGATLSAAVVAAEAPLMALPQVDAGAINIASSPAAVDEPPLLTILSPPLPQADLSVGPDGDSAQSQNIIIRQ